MSEVIDLNKFKESKKREQEEMKVVAGQKEPVMRIHVSYGVTRWLATILCFGMSVMGIIMFARIFTGNTLPLYVSGPVGCVFMVSYIAVIIQRAKAKYFKHKTALAVYNPLCAFLVILSTCTLTYTFVHMTTMSIGGDMQVIVNGVKATQEYQDLSKGITQNRKMIDDHQMAIDNVKPENREYYRPQIIERQTKISILEADSEIKRQKQEEQINNALMFTKASLVIGDMLYVTIIILAAVSLMFDVIPGTLLTRYIYRVLEANGSRDFSETGKIVLEYIVPDRFGTLRDALLLLHPGSADEVSGTAKNVDIDADGSQPVSRIVRKVARSTANA